MNTFIGGFLLGVVMIMGGTRVTCHALVDALIRRKTDRRPDCLDLKEYQTAEGERVIIGETALIGERALRAWTIPLRSIISTERGLLLCAYITYLDHIGVQRKGAFRFRTPAERDAFARDLNNRRNRATKNQ
jgi:hypothetical protein